MSDLGGSTLSRVNDEGTQRTTEGGRGVDPRCPHDQEKSSFSSEGPPSCVGAIVVITWLKSIGDAQADAF